MTTLADLPEEELPERIHLLLISPTKVGKSTYVAQAAIDGFTVCYVDSDNGLSALRRKLKDHPEAMARVIYIPTQHPANMLEKWFVEERLFRWDMTRDAEYNSLLSKESLVLEVDIPKFLSAHNLVFSMDSWTSVAGDAMEIGADKAKVALTEMGNSSQQVYGNANRRATLIAASFQAAPFHCIVQAHATIYERYSKPLGKTAANMKQNEFVLEETTEIPLSTSRPHGYEMGKYFNHIGWLVLSKKDFPPKTMIDFTRKADRVGGGPPNIIADVNEFGFAQLAKPGPIPEGTFRMVRASEMIQPAALPAAGHQGALKSGTPPEVTPAKPDLSKLFKKA